MGNSIWTKSTARGVLEHELGHTNRLELTDYKSHNPLPRSIMNYSWVSGFPYNGATKVSYSNGTGQPLCPGGVCPGIYGDSCDCNEWARIFHL